MTFESQSAEELWLFNRNPIARLNDIRDCGVAMEYILSNSNGNSQWPIIQAVYPYRIQREEEGLSEG